MNIFHRHPTDDGKSFSYFDYLERFGIEGCPLCSMVVDREKRYASSLFYENVNDVLIRKKFREARGFCEVHSNLLLEAGDPLGLAIIMNDLVAEVIAHPEKGSVDKDCPLCQFFQEVENRLIDNFPRYLLQADFRAKFQTSSGFCYRHYTRISKGIKDKSLNQWFLQIHLKLWTEQAALLAELIEKSDYQHSNDEITSAELNSPKWAIKFLCKKR